MRIVEELKVLAKKMTGKDSNGKVISEVIRDIHEGYSGGGGGSSAESVLYFKTNLIEYDGETKRVKITDTDDIAMLEAIENDFRTNKKYPTKLIEDFSDEAGNYVCIYSLDSISEQGTFKMNFNKAGSDTNYMIFDNVTITHDVYQDDETGDMVNEWHYESSKVESEKNQVG